MKPLLSKTWKLKSDARCIKGNKWVAKISSISGNAFELQYIEASKREKSKFGMEYAEFEIKEPGYYQDSDGDYFKAEFEIKEKEVRVVCKVCELEEILKEFN